MNFGSGLKVFIRIILCIYKKIRKREINGREKKEKNSKTRKIIYIYLYIYKKRFLLPKWV